jgi:hypothetical protein
VWVEMLLLLEAAFFILRGFVVRVEAMRIRLFLFICNHGRSTAMVLVPYKKFKLTTKLTRDEFLSRIKAHAEYSKSKSFFSALSDDFLIKLKIKEDRIEVRKRFEKQISRITFFMDNEDAAVHVKMVLRPVAIVMTLFMTLWVFLIPFPLALKIIFAVLIYGFMMMGFLFDVFWTQNLLHKKLLKP